MKVFDFDDYKKYLNTQMSTEGEGRGRRGRLARHLGCQSGFVSQVLNGHTHFSLEHGTRINIFFDHDEEESHFFMLLLQLGRSGSVELEKYFKDQIHQIVKKREKVKERIKVSSELDEKDYLIYYSQWYYSALHILAAIPGFDQTESLADHLRLSLPVAKEAMKFLIEKGLVNDEEGILTIGEARIHVDRNSPLFVKHHTNWRLEGIKALERIKDDNLHYSGVIALSQDDYQKIKDILLSSIEESEKILRDSKEEVLASLSLDLFKL